jgi:hypothetical protein
MDHLLSREHEPSGSNPTHFVAHEPCIITIQVRRCVAPLHFTNCIYPDGFIACRWPTVAQ